MSGAAARQTPGFQHRARRTHVILAGAVCVLLVIVADAGALARIAAVVVGLAVGRAVGAAEWKRFRQQIDRRNVAVTYVEDTAYFAVLAAVATAGFSPGLLLRLGVMAALPPGILWAGLIGTAAACTGWAYVLYRCIEAHEHTFGPLRIRTFYARSLVGPEALIGRRGIVVEACAPDGRVRVDAELWFAQASDGVPISAGTQVIVRDVEGLRLIVENSAASGRPPASS